MDRVTSTHTESRGSWTEPTYISSVSTAVVESQVAWAARHGRQAVRSSITRCSAVLAALSRGFRGKSRCAVDGCQNDVVGTIKVKIDFLVPPEVDLPLCQYDMDLILRFRTMPCRLVH